MHPHEALDKLLLSLFSADELRRFIRYLPEGDKLSAQLPGGTVSAAHFVDGAVTTLDNHGLLADPDFWTRLAAERPRRKREIDDVRALFLKNGGAPATSIAAPPATASAPRTTPAAPPTAAAPAPDKLVVLMVSASPDVAVRLRVDQEFKQIIKAVRSSEHRERLQFEQLQAASFDDLHSALMQHQPHVLHVSSHGTDKGELLFEADGQGSRTVAKKNLLNLLDALSDRLRLVFLNACFSHLIASDIPSTIDLAIGMNRAVFDAPAIAFATAFYETLGYGYSVEKAFKAARAKLHGDDDEVPELFPPADHDPASKRKQPLVVVS